MHWRPPISTRTYTRVPYTTLFRSVHHQLDRLVAQMTVEKALAKGFARRGGGILARQRVEQAVHRRVFSLVLDRGTATLLLEPDRFFDEIARDLLDVAADIAQDRKSTRLNSSH